MYDSELEWEQNATDTTEPGSNEAKELSHVTYLLQMLRKFRTRVAMKPKRSYPMSLSTLDVTQTQNQGSNEAKGYPMSLST